jgi:hypothetical protein
VSDELTQAEADSLFAMEKVRADTLQRRFPAPGEFVSAPLISRDKREQFLLDVNRRSLNISRVSFQSRARVTTILARLDLGGAPHGNPNDEEIGVPHIHLYCEGFVDKWAMEVPPGKFRNLEDRWETLLDFMRFCSVIEAPEFTRDLVS